MQKIQVLVLGVILAEVVVAAPPSWGKGWLGGKKPLVEIYQVEIIEVPPIPSVLAFDFDAERKKWASGRQLTPNIGEEEKKEEAAPAAEEPKEEAPAEEPPKEEAAAEEPPKEEAPAAEEPKMEEAPPEEPPKEEKPAEK